jgi:hypothetical protein
VGYKQRCLDVWRFTLGFAGERYCFNLYSLEIFNWAELPWENVSELDAMKRMQNREKLPRPGGCPTAIYDIMMGCWKLDVKRRSSSSDVLAALQSFAEDPDHKVQHPPFLDWPNLMDIDERLLILKETSSVFPLNLTSETLLVQFDALEIQPNTLTLLEVLGRGQFGTVSKGSFHKLKEDVTVSVAVKQLSGDGVPEVEQKQFEYEARLLTALQHPNIVEVVGVQFKRTPRLLVLELMDCDLRSYLIAHAGELAGQVEALTNTCFQIAHAMTFLERRRVIHRDLAARLEFASVCAFMI